MNFNPTAGRPMSEAEAAVAARQIFEKSFGPDQMASSTESEPVRHFPTSFRDESPTPTHGDAPPVWQDDKRVVPPWAAGLAVASIGVGAGATGLGCAAWLLFKGLALVSVPALSHFALIVIAPFAGAAMVLTAAGTAIAKAKSSSTTNVYEGSVVQNTQINNTSHQRGMFSRTRNDVR
ncbi:hypothetical protein ABZ896_28390 [Streptomyces sp. NPDC047072]|uniref:hypothetical protein n=1 Tax=Streptomyces sp. NPDC047072 TaxID=3154809 RepID=UPI0033FD7B47